LPGVLGFLPSGEKTPFSLSRLKLKEVLDEPCNSSNDMAASSLSLSTKI